MNHDDFSEIKQRLRDERAELTPLEADALHPRVVRRVERRPGRLATLRRRGLATVLVSGAIVSSGGTAVLAATTLTGGTTSTFTPSTYHPRSSGCQYHPSWTKTFSFNKDYSTYVTVTISYDCKTNKFTITITCSKPITYYYCNGKKYTVPSSTKTTTIVLDPGTHSVSVTSSGGTIKFPLVLSP